MLHYLGHIRPLVQEVLEGLVEQVAGKEGQGAQEERRNLRHGAESRDLRGLRTGRCMVYTLPRDTWKPAGNSGLRVTNIFPAIFLHQYVLLYTINIHFFKKSISVLQWLRQVPATGYEKSFNAFPGVAGGHFPKVLGIFYQPYRRFC